MSARGRIALVTKFIEGELELSKKLDDRIFSCILCGACNKLCPLGINVTDTIYEVRNHIRGFNKKRILLGLGIKLVLKKASNLFKALKLLETINEIIPIFRLYPFSIIKRMDITIPTSMLKDKGNIFRVSKPKGRIAIFTGCTVNFLYPNIGISLIESLNAMNYDVILPKSEVCCGAPLMGLGLKEDAAEMAEKNIKAFKKLNVEAVVGFCPTCIDFIKNGYKNLFGDAIDNAVEVSQFFKDNNEFASLLVSSQHSVAGYKNTSSQPESPKSRKTFGGAEKGSQESHRFYGTKKVIYHDPCHSVYSLNISDEPRKILQSVGLDIIDSEKGCCGFGGTFRLLYQELSEGILEKRIKEYQKADMIVTSCPNCIIQLKSKINDRPIKHIVEVINEYIKSNQKIG
ncbi:hypothetical protein JZK55_05270 [Dissulfurispira thermophila]|uniref:4Fe-4S ferredoxin-type domain-containing protein n=2 Tax=root TaxID=1 RepID=A0A7G1GYS0_9BACT|nr:hypothetical protein JZK55_05270 [Dissulfurispira thermophila]